MTMSPGSRPSHGILPASVSSTPRPMMAAPMKMSILPRSDTGPSSKQLPLRAHAPSGAPEVLEGQSRGGTPLGCPTEITFLDQKGLVDVFDGVTLLADGRGQRFDSDRAAS